MGIKAKALHVSIVLVALSLGTFIAIAITDIATLNYAWCDARPLCLLNWIGALSGWAAAGGAIAAAFLTLPYLKKQSEEARRQANEAKRQADFLLGESSPSMDVVEHLEAPGALVVRIENLNRRSIFIRSIRFRGSLKARIDKVEVDDKGIDIDAADHFERPFAVHGWTNRDREPHLAKIRLYAIEPQSQEVVEIWDDQSVVEVEIHVAGAEHRTEMLFAKVLAH